MPSRMPSGGGVINVRPRATTTVEVGPSRTAPSLPTKITSSAPLALAYRCAAMLTA